MLTYRSIARLDITHDGTEYHIIYNPCLLNTIEIKAMLEDGTAKTSDKLIFVTKEQADSMFRNPCNTNVKPDVNFYIGQENASGINVNCWDEFVGHLYEAFCTAIQSGKKNFDITIDTHE